MRIEEAGAEPSARSAVSPRRLARDLVKLGKPPISVMAVLAAAAGMAGADGDLAPATAGLLLAGIGLAVGGACCLNMFVERRSDRLMHRTQARPLPSGRIPSWAALTLGLSSVALGVALLWAADAIFAAGLTALAALLYAGVYTPLKRVTPAAFLIGLIPGAMPPLAGRVAALGEIDQTGLVLFGLMAIWQVPHVAAVSLWFEKDYRLAGIHTWPLRWGRERAVLAGTICAWLLAPLAAASPWLGLGGWVFAGVATAAGLWQGWQYRRRMKQGRYGSFFRASLVYLGVVVLALLVDGAVG